MPPLPITQMRNSAQTGAMLGRNCFEYWRATAYNWNGNLAMTSRKVTWNVDKLEKRPPQLSVFRRPSLALTYRLLPTRCNNQLTAKLTNAPMAANAAVFSTSCNPSWPTILNSVPPPVPMPSRWSIFILSSFLGAVLHGFQHTQCQREVTGY